MTALLTRRYLVDYARRPLNLVLLAVVPVVFVILSAGAIADFALILGGDASFAQLEAATAGWAAAFLAGVAGFFHVSTSRAPDRRLAVASSATASVVGARLISALALAGIAVAGALAALVVRTDIVDPGRAIAATVMFAVIYIGIGALLGAIVRSEVNGSLILVLVWMFDVFLGPAMARTDAVLTRAFPSHFPTLVMLDATTTHAGPLGDLGASLAWTFGSLSVGFVALLVTTRQARQSHASRLSAGFGRLRVGLTYAWREYRRNFALWVLLVVLPVLFITLSIATTPDDPAPVELSEAGERAIAMVSMAEVHGALMVAITVAFLAGLAGLFVALGSAEADRRLVLTGFRPREVLGARLGVVVIAAVLVSATSLMVTAASFQPERWLTFAFATGLIAVTYAMIGVLLGPLVGRLGGLYLMFLLPFLDVGLAQNIMLAAAPPAWAVWMPAHGAMRVLVDGAFTSSFDETAGLLLGLAWLAGITAMAVGVFHRLAAPRHA